MWMDFGFCGMLFDSHFHPPPDVAAPAYAEAARDAGVGGLLAVAGDAADAIRARDFAAAVPGAWFSAGIHPHAAGTWDGSLEHFRDLAADPHCVAIGEIGLDYYYENCAPMTQRRVLSKFMELAVEMRRPAILHCRDRDGHDDAYRDLHAGLRELVAAGGAVVVHCYTGSIAWAERLMAAGALLGVTGIVTFPRGENVREVVRRIPGDRLLLETDSPYLAPVPHRGETNHPRFLPEVARRVAAERGMGLAEVAALTTANACRLFGIDAGEVGHG